MISIRSCDSGDAFLESTPAVLPWFQVKAGLEFTLAIGVERLRAYSLEQQALLIDVLAEHGINADGARVDRGAFVTLTHPAAEHAAQTLKARGVNCDARGGCLRLGPDVLNTRDELRQAGGIVAEAIGAQRC